MAKFPTMQEMAKNVAERALDEYEYKGKTIRQWVAMLCRGDCEEVVRCKDCVLHGHCSTEDVFLFSRLKSENAFCCVGKRKEDNNENSD